MKRIAILVTLVALLVACGNAGAPRQQGGDENASAEVVIQYQRWQGHLPFADVGYINEAGDSIYESSGVLDIRFARYGDAFRGELIDPGFQDFASVPIFGTINEQGEVKGYGALSPETGVSLGVLDGQITDNVFHAHWMLLTEDGQFYEMDLHPAKDEAWEAADGKYPAAFFNTCYMEFKFVDIETEESPETRVFPFVPEKPLSGKRKYGYHLGELYNGSITLSPGTEKGEVAFNLTVAIGGKFDIEVAVNGTATLDGNRFRYKDAETGYEFEATIHTDFVHVRTLSGAMATYDEGDELKADGVYAAEMGMTFYN